MKIIGIVPGTGYPKYILEATDDEIAHILGKYWAGEDNLRSKLEPGAQIAVDAIYHQNEKVGSTVVDLKKLPTTLRAFADILSRELEFLAEPKPKEEPKVG